MDITGSINEDLILTLKDFFIDGLHLSKLGCDVSFFNFWNNSLQTYFFIIFIFIFQSKTLFAGLMKVIRESYAELDPNNIPMILPEWDKFDPKKSLVDSLKLP